MRNKLNYMQMYFVLNLIDMWLSNYPLQINILLKKSRFDNVCQVSFIKTMFTSDKMLKFKTEF